METKRPNTPWLLGCSVLLLLAACRDSNVVAQVGRTELRQEDLTHFAAQRSPAARQTPTELLEALVARELLAEEARRTGLADTPQVRARLAAAQREVLAQALLEEKLKGAAGDGELRARYEAQKQSLVRRRVHVRHLMVPLSGGAAGEEQRAAQARMGVLHARLVGGETFDAVAKEVATGEGGVQAQLLEGVEEGQVHPAFFAAAVALQKGETSRPFLTPFGVHVLQALEAPETVVPPFEAVRGQLTAEARREAEAALFQKLTDDIRVRRYPERVRMEPAAAAPAVKAEGAENEAG